MTEPHTGAAPVNSRDPTVWVLLGKGAGGNAQMLELARALGWPFEAKQLAHNPLNVLPNLLLDASLLSLNVRRSSPLTPPWPDLVIAASRRSVPVARWIRSRSGGRTRLVHLLHAMAPLRWFDLIITTPQYALPQRPNVVRILAPLNRIPAQRIETACGQWAPRLAHLPRPWLALLVGGSSSSYLLGTGVADRLGREASDLAAAAGGSLLVTTSPRTPATAVDALFKAVREPAFKYPWRPDDADNPYLAFLGLADRFMVTADSASLVAEAVQAGKPVSIFDWPMRPLRRYGPKTLLHAWLTGGAEVAAPGPVRRRARAVLDWLVEVGLVKPPRNFNLYHQLLRERGLLAGSEAGAKATRPDDDMKKAVAAIRALFAQ